MPYTRVDLKAFGGPENLDIGAGTTRAPCRGFAFLLRFWAGRFVFSRPQTRSNLDAVRELNQVQKIGAGQ